MTECAQLRDNVCAALRCAGWAPTPVPEDALFTALHHPCQVFEYFCERTPRSFVEQRGTSLVWNYKYAGGWQLLCEHMNWFNQPLVGGSMQAAHTPGVELQIRGWVGID